MKKLLYLVMTFILLTSTLMVSPIKVNAVGNTYWTDSWDDAYSTSGALDELTFAEDELANLYDADADAYLVTTGEELALIAYAVNWGYDFTDEEVHLNNDIDLSGHNWMPIGYIETDSDVMIFSGILNGNNNTISNLTMNFSDYSKSVGLFGYTANASIFDVKLQSVSINVTGDYGSVGALIGEAENTFVRNVHAISGSVDFVDTGDSTGVGGIVGYFFEYSEDPYFVPNSSSTISYSSSNLAINVSGEFADSIGGIVGGLDSGTVTISYANGIITALDSECVGGLVGYNYGAVIDTYSRALVEGFQDVGGLVGLNNGIIETSYATGTVTSENTERVGSFVGQHDSETTIYASFYPYSETLVGGYYYDYDAVSYEIIVNGFDADGYGITWLSDEEFTIEDPFMSYNWDFDSIWIITPDLNNGYPTFLYLNNIVTPDSFTITYFMDGGSNYDNAPVSVTSDDTYTLGTPTKSGYTFNGWFTDSGYTNPISNIGLGTEADIALYAKWTVVPINTTPSTPVQSISVEPIPATGIDPSLAYLLPLGIAALLYRKKTN